jgi:hypothetical protein
MKFNLLKTLKEALVGKNIRGRKVQNVRLSLDNADNITICIHFSAFDFLDHIKILPDSDIEIDED